MGNLLRRAKEKIEILNNLSNDELLDRAWDEIRLLCGADGAPKKWSMSIPVDADRDSDVLFGEILKRFRKLKAENEMLKEYIIEEVGAEHVLVEWGGELT